MSDNATADLDDPRLTPVEHMAGTHTWMAPHANISRFCSTQRMPGFWPLAHGLNA